MSRKRKVKKVPTFISLFGRDNKLNSSLIEEVFPNNDRFYVKDIYGMTFRIDEKTYKLLKEEM